jgi:hypothetical protein
MAFLHVEKNGGCHFCVKTGFLISPKAQTIIAVAIFGYPHKRQLCLFAVTPKTKILK